MKNSLEPEVVSMKNSHEPMVCSTDFVPSSTNNSLEPKPEESDFKGRRVKKTPQAYRELILETLSILLVNSMLVGEYENDCPNIT